MSHAASPCPDADPAVTPATPSASSQFAGIRELVRIAELQAQAYARDAPAEQTAGSVHPAPEGCQVQVAAVPEQGARPSPDLPRAR
jgi:hypothetical protein